MPHFHIFCDNKLCFHLHCILQDISNLQPSEYFDKVRELHVYGWNRWNFFLVSICIFQEIFEPVTDPFDIDSDFECSSDATSECVGARYCSRSCKPADKNREYTGSWVDFLHYCRQTGRGWPSFSFKSLQERVKYHFLLTGASFFLHVSLFLGWWAWAFRENWENITTIQCVSSSNKLA